VLVEPVKSDPMLVAEPLRDPDDRSGVRAGRVGEYLAEVPVIARFDLVLDDEPCTKRKVCADKVE
jgi:hypothetical protein